jgi:ATP-binding cassette subfamily B protein
MEIAISKKGEEKQNNSWQSVRLVFPFFKQYGKQLVIGFLSLLAVNALQLIIPRIIKHAVDGLQNDAVSQANLMKYGGLIILLAFSIAFFRFGWRILILGFSRHLEKDLRNWMFSHLLTLDRFFFQRNTTGELMALATNDLAAVQLAGGMGLVAFADAVVMTIAAVSFMAYIHPGLTLIALAPMPVLALLTRILSARLHKYFKKVQEKFSQITEFVRTTLSSMRLIKAYTQEKSQTERFNTLGRTYVKDNLRLAMIQGTLFPTAGLVANISMLLVLFFGGRLTIQGAITIGDFVAFTSYLFMLTWPMMALGWVTNLFQRGATSLERIQNILEQQTVFDRPVSPSVMPKKIRNISVRDLSFQYQRQKQPVLKGISLQINPGLLGIVGRTGAGKTTLCHLLARLYPVEAGTIFFSDIDVNDMGLDDIRSCIGLVPQDVTVFSDTIRTNITMGRPQATDEQIEKVARAAAIHDEIITFPAGYETRIGERGVKLSGGQRQRIALARVLLAERPIIIIDDGLSAVDIETEHQIIRSIGSFLQERICIVVSHRLAPLADADQLLVMDDGQIVAQGNHNQLLKENMFYKTIFEYQISRMEKNTGSKESRFQGIK